jgi:S-DNA-T family DNA segregation ATPase FtsK/SpoIIIE
LRDLDLWDEVASRASDCDTLAERLRDVVAEREPGAPTLLIVIDDANELSDTTAESALEEAARRGRDVGVSIVAAADMAAAHRSYSGLFSEVRKDRRGLLLTPDPDVDGELLGVRLPRSVGRFPAGRGFLVEQGTLMLVQVAR